VPAPWPRLGHPDKHDLESWRVFDNWPARVPVTDAEIDVFKAWFGDLFNDVFGRSHCRRKIASMTVPLHATVYLRVSTARQAEHDVSIPDQNR
jgi:hypothetical protein